MFYNQQLNIMIILWYYIWSRNLLFNRLLTFTSFRSFSSSKPFASAPIESFPYSFEKSVLSNASFISFTWMKKKKNYMVLQVIKCLLIGDNDDKLLWYFSAKKATMPRLLTKTLFEVLLSQSPTQCQQKREQKQPLIQEMDLSSFNYG